jgi:hypothetical protein
VSAPKRVKRDAPRGAMKLYKSYMFKNKDPVIDELRTLVADTYERVGFKAYQKIEADGGPSISCMTAWFEGDTKRPQSASVEAAGRALGFKRVWVRNNGNGNGGKK